MRKSGILVGRVLDVERHRRVQGKIGVTGDRSRRRDRGDLATGDGHLAGVDDIAPVDLRGRSARVPGPGSCHPGCP